MEKNTVEPEKKVTEIRLKRFEVRLNEKEWDQFLELEKSTGKGKSDLVRQYFLEDSMGFLVNLKDMMRRLDVLGVELGNARKGINRLIIYAHKLETEGQLDTAVLQEFIPLLSEFVDLQRKLEASFRRHFRVLKRRK